MNQNNDQPDAPMTEEELRYLLFRLGEILNARLGGILVQAGLPSDYLTRIITLRASLDPATAAIMPATSLGERHRQARELIELAERIEDPLRNFLPSHPRRN